MKNTGVIRKIDELGRIVIPKEIRKNLNIRSGEDVQIFVEDEQIVLKKYQKLLSIKEKSQKILDKFSSILNSTIVITDNENVISATNNAFLDKKIDNKIIVSIGQRKSDNGNSLLIGGEVVDKKYYMIPIIIDADAIGSIIAISDEEISVKDLTIMDVLSILISLDLY